ncbi:MAG TPA: pancreas/duodenum homeobox protein 1 [Desulfurivibrio alkaliphilus]|uniref:Pancreas/duodenum homeobox protein 1 n=1 Tax=Desulfurivibrio alkaliphilus TaxID=427923 RepID=A0A7C2THB0_9BACT|nr:pancreas/duodenum homeobox protein 1 [Desulfurivibrio alkaliphilus]
MNEATIRELLNEETLAALFPAERADQFFDALFGDAAEGSYDIKLSLERYDSATHTLQLALELHERPGKCLACNLTYGLPEVFSRHPVINIKGLVEAIDQLLGERAHCKEWRLGGTRESSKALHIIPLIITME